MRGEALAARNALSLAQARAAADGAVERMAFELSRPRNIADVWQPDGAAHVWQDGEARFAVSAVDESARIDLNAAPEPLLKGLLQNVGGLDADTAQHVVEAIEDWRDADDLRRPNGAEDADYRAAGRKYGPANAPFSSVGELQRVLGMTPGADGADRRRAHRVLVAGGDQPGDGVARRSARAAEHDAGASSMPSSRSAATRSPTSFPSPPLPQATGFAIGAASVWRIHAEATMADGVTFVRDAVLRPSADPRRPLIALLWQEGVARAGAGARRRERNCGA